MKLEIEEDAVPLGGERPDDDRPLGREQLVADLEAADAAAQRVGELQRLAPGRHVERDQELIHACSSLDVSSVPVSSAIRVSPWRCM